MLQQENNLLEIGKRLRIAREGLGLSLDDVSERTKINRQHLQDIECGVFPKLPMPYIRAFIRDYSSLVNLNSVELLKLLEEPIKSNVNTTGQALTMDDKLSEQVIPKHRGIRIQQRILLPLIIGVILIGLIVIVKFFQPNKYDGTYIDYSLTEAIKDIGSQDQVSKLKSNSIDSSDTGTSLLGDLLILEAVARESVWIQLTIDRDSMFEYILIPSNRMRWEAKNEYVLSIGNPRGLNLTLNGKKVELPVSVRAPLKNFTISRHTLERLNKKSTLKSQ